MAAIAKLNYTPTANPTGVKYLSDAGEFTEPGGGGGGSPGGTTGQVQVNDPAQVHLRRLKGLPPRETGVVASIKRMFSKVTP